MRLGEILGLQWDNVHISDADIVADNARVMVVQELTRVSRDAGQFLDEKDIIQVFHSMMNGTSTNLVKKNQKQTPALEKYGFRKQLHYLMADRVNPESLKKSLINIKMIWDCQMLFFTPSGIQVQLIN